MIFIATIAVFMLPVIRSFPVIKIHEDVQNLNISCDTVQIFLNNQNIDYCSLLSWETPNKIKCATNTSAAKSSVQNNTSRCTIECSTETLPKFQNNLKETNNEGIRITLWLYIESPGLSHSGKYFCWPEMRNYEIFEFREKPGRSCQYDDQCRSGICHQNLCRCHSENENFLPESGKCIQRKKLGDPCQFDKQCQFNEYQVQAAWAGFKPNFTQPSCISSKCQCPNGTVKHRIANNQVCISKASYGEPCFTNAQCQLQSEQLYCDYEDYEDNKKTCQCKDGYRWGQDECGICHQNLCRCHLQKSDQCIKRTFEKDQISLKIKRYKDVQNLNISCKTVQLLYLNNKISDCSLLSWRAPGQVKCVTNTPATNSTGPNLHSRCTIQCSTETFTEVQGETRNEWIKITQWMNIKSPGLSHSGNYSCYLNRTYFLSRTIEFKENPDRTCQYDDQCQSRICHLSLCRCHSVNENYLPESDQCIKRKKLGDSCQFDKQCHFNTYQVHTAWAGFKPNFTQPICHFSKCQCPLGTVKHRIANYQVCISKASHGEPCFTKSQCQLQSEQLYCHSNYENNKKTCQCQDGYRWGQDKCVPIRKCVGKVGCRDGQYCDQGVCRCKDGFRWKRDECEPHRICDSNRNCEYGQHCEQNVCKSKLRGWKAL